MTYWFDTQHIYIDQYHMIYVINDGEHPYAISIEDLLDKVQKKKK